MKTLVVTAAVLAALSSTASAQSAQDVYDYYAAEAQYWRAQAEKMKAYKEAITTAAYMDAYQSKSGGQQTTGYQQSGYGPPVGQFAPAPVYAPAPAYRAPPPGYYQAGYYWGAWQRY